MQIQLVSSSWQEELNRVCSTCTVLGDRCLVGTGRSTSEVSQSWVLSSHLTLSLTFTLFKECDRDLCLAQCTLLGVTGFLDQPKGTHVWSHPCIKGHTLCFCRHPMRSAMSNHNLHPQSLHNSWGNRVKLIGSFVRSAMIKVYNFDSHNFCCRSP
jgi:hypothetical protein